jgi:hypothetical protein
MTDDNRGGPPSRGGRPGGGPGGNRDNRGGGGGPGGRRDGQRGGPRKGGGGFGKGPVRQERAETYETLKELERGEGFRIDKYVVAEKKSHKPVKTEYRLTREGLKQTLVFQRLTEAKEAATAPLPEPEPEPIEDIVETVAEVREGETAIEESAPEEPASEELAEESVAEVEPAEPATEEVSTTEDSAI